MQFWNSRNAKEAEALRYLVAIFAPIVTTLLRSACDPFFHGHQAFLFSNLAVIAIAIFVGWGPALLCLGLSITFDVPLFLSPSHTLDLSTDRVTALVSHTLVSVVVIFLAQRQRQAKEQAHAFAQDTALLNAELEDRVAQRTTELQEANADLAGFMNSIAHDMRQYLRGINVAAWTVIEDHRDRLDEEGRMNLESLGRNARQASLLVDGLLEFSRLGKNEIARRDIDLSEVANQVVRRLVGRIPDPCSEIDIQPMMFVQGDPQLLDLALQNLIENALKYRADSATTRIKVGSRVEADATVYFVEDNGIGFDMKFVDHIFLPFERLHRVSEYPGTGIGLANVKRIVEKHGGRIWAESEPGKGSKFFFTLGRESLPALSEAA